MSAAAHNHHREREGHARESAENYAKVIYQLQPEGEGPVGTGAVAERLGVTPASASAMLKRMADDGLVEHTPYRGVRLTARGEQVALEVIRHHRLLELFLAEELGMPWDRVHQEAEVLEHHISEELPGSRAASCASRTATARCCATWASGGSSRGCRSGSAPASHSAGRSRSRSAGTRIRSAAS